MTNDHAHEHVSAPENQRRLGSDHETDGVQTVTDMPSPFPMRGVRLPPSYLIALQRTVGNHMTQHLLQRQHVIQRNCATPPTNRTFMLKVTDEKHIYTMGKTDMNRWVNDDETRRAHVVSVDTLVESSGGWGVPEDGFAALNGFVTDVCAVLAAQEFAVVNCNQGAHRSVVVAILAISRMTQQKVRAVFDAVGSSNAQVKNSLITYCKRAQHEPTVSTKRRSATRGADDPPKRSRSTSRTRTETSAKHKKGEVPAPAEVEEKEEDATDDPLNYIVP